MPESFHVCFVGQNFPLTYKVSDKENLWPVAVKLKELGVNVTIINFKGPYNEEEVSVGGCKMHFIANGADFIASEDFPKLALKKIAQIHSKNPIDHIHSLDTPFKKFKHYFKKSTPSLSYGVQISSIEEMSGLIGLSDDTIIGNLKATLFYPTYFIWKYFFKDYLTLKKAQGVFVSSPKQALSLERYYLYPPNWIFKIPLDNYTSDLILRKKSPQLMQSLGLKKDSLVLMTASKMNNVKELLFLLDIFEQTALLYPQARFLVLGNGPKYQEIEREVLLKALDSKVTFVKNIPRYRLPDYIALSNIFINMSSTTSGFGPTLIEAMAQEKVIIGSEFSPISSIIRDGENGFLARPGETGKCSSLIDQVFSGKVDSQSLGKKARDDIEKILNRDQLTEKTLDAFKKINSRGFRLFSLPFFN